MDFFINFQPKFSPLMKWSFVGASSSFKLELEIRRFSSFLFVMSVYHGETGTWLYTRKNEQVLGCHPSSKLFSMLITFN